MMHADEAIFIQKSRLHIINDIITSKAETFVFEYPCTTMLSCNIIKRLLLEYTVPELQAMDYQCMITTKNETHNVELFIYTTPKTSSNGAHTKTNNENGGVNNDDTALLMDDDEDDITDDEEFDEEAEDMKEDNGVDDVEEVEDDEDDEECSDCNPLFTRKSHSHPKKKHRTTR